MRPAAASTASISAPTPNPDARGRYRVGGEFSYITIGVYLFLIVLLLVVALPESAAYPYAVDFVIAATAFFLIRYLSTSYLIDDMYLHAFRLAGGRRLRLSEVRKIEFVRLRDLSPTGFFGSWGWRGRMWSPTLGPFDAVYSDPAGILVTAGGVPLFISPRKPQEFARELSRRARSYTGPLAVDVGGPGTGF